MSSSSLKVVHSSNKAWDTSRTKHTDALDAILESLGTQLVPPEFHQSPEDSSLFGSQHSEPEAEASRKQKRIPRKKANGPLVSPQSPSATLRHHQGSGSLKEDKSKDDREIDKEKKDDRKRWKTLRDFVDDQAIEDIYETIEDDRTALDVRGALRILAFVYLSKLARSFSARRMTFRKLCPALLRRFTILCQNLTQGHQL